MSRTIPQPKHQLCESSLFKLIGFVAALGHISLNVLMPSFTISNLKGTDKIIGNDFICAL